MRNHHAAAFSAIIKVGKLVFPLTMVGMTPRIDDAESADAPYPQVAVDHGHGIVIPPHLGGADRVKDRRGDLARELDQLGIALELDTRLVLDGTIGRERGLGRHAPNLPEAVDRDLTILVCAEVVGRDRDGIARPVRTDADRPAARWIEELSLTRQRTTL